MKTSSKITSLLVSLALVLICPNICTHKSMAAGGGNTPLAKTVYGDVEHKGYISTGDAIMIMKHTLGEIKIPSENLVAAGLPASGPKLEDALNIMKILANTKIVRVTGVVVSQPSKTDSVGKSFSINANITPSNATNKNISYSSSNPTVATVDANGKVTLKTAGSAIITAATVDGNYTARCSVTAKNLPAANTLTHEKTNYCICKNYSDSYRYDQRSYHKFDEGGTNVGCSATAEAIGASVYYGKRIAPDNSKIIWTPYGAAFGLAKFCNCNVPLARKLSIAYNQLKKGNPTIINTLLPGSTDHWVTIVGVKQGANGSNLKTSDFLIVNPWGGTVYNFDTYLKITGRYIPDSYSIRSYAQ